MVRVSEEHPELFHYTNIDGLKGIIEDQKLWATHYKYLNDYEEILHFRKRLSEMLPQMFGSIIDEMELVKRKELIKSNGGREHTISKLVGFYTDLIYSSAFGGVNKKPLFEPYIVSFCSINRRWPEQKKINIQNHGLLSQWRAYGKNGGYALVFDTLEMERLFELVCWQKEYQSALICDVLYSNTHNEQIENEFSEDLDQIKKVLKAYTQENDNQLSDMFESFYRCACRYKHWGFEEEQEVRIILTPYANEIKGIASVSKPIYFRVKSGISIPYMKLFDNLDQKLPIKRIIIGPSPDSNLRKKSIELLLEKNNISAKVQISEIPYAE